MLHFPLKEQHGSGGCTGVSRGVGRRIVVSLLFWTSEPWGKKVGRARNGKVLNQSAESISDPT